MISSREFTKFGTTSNGSWVDKTYTGAAQLTTMNSNIKTLTRGNKQFEMCNHLGNVLVTIQDRKRSVDLNADNAADYYMPYLRTVTNYYAFGSAMPGIGGSVKECSVSSSTATLKKFPYYHTFSNDSTSGFTPGSGARTVSNPTHNVLHLESVWSIRPLANKSIYLKSGVTYDLKFNIAGFSVVSGYSHTVKVRILLPGSVLSYTYTAAGNQTIHFTSNTTGYVTVEISSQINGSGSYSINPYIDIDNFNLSWDSTYNTSVNNCGTNPENYKYGFNTQEKDNEIAGENNIYSAEYWEYDARVARRWNVDPIFKEYESPFACLGNNPICVVDINGADTFDTNGKLIRETKDHSINIQCIDNGKEVTKDITAMALTTVAQRIIIARVVEYYANQIGIKDIKKGGAGSIGLWAVGGIHSVAFTRYDEKNGYGIWLNFRANGKIGLQKELTDKYYLINAIYHEKLHQDDMVAFKKTYTGDMKDFNAKFENSRYNYYSRHAEIYIKQFEHFSFSKLDKSLQKSQITIFLAYVRGTINQDGDGNNTANNLINQFNAKFKGTYEILYHEVNNGLCTEKTTYTLYDIKAKTTLQITEDELQKIKI